MIRFTKGKVHIVMKSSVWICFNPFNLSLHAGFGVTPGDAYKHYVICNAINGTLM